MSPLASTSLALLIVAAAGLPLFRLLSSAPPPLVSQQEQTNDAAETTLPTYVTVRFTGRPLSLELRRGGETIGRLEAGTGDNAAGAEGDTEDDAFPWEFRTELPAPLTSIDLEVEALWPDAGPQAVTITLEPAGAPAADCTRWTLSRGRVMLDHFTFTWP